MSDESKFPTVKDYAERFADLVEKGLGDLPLQVVVAPVSTMEALNLHFGGEGKRPALMIELFDPVKRTDRQNPSLVSSGYVDRSMYGCIPLSRRN